MWVYLICIFVPFVEFNWFEENRIFDQQGSDLDVLIIGFVTWIFNTASWRHRDARVTSDLGNQAPKEARESAGLYKLWGGSHNLRGGKSVSGSHLWEGSPLSGRMYDEHRHLDPRQVRSGRLNMPPPLFRTAILGVWLGGIVEERWQPHKVYSPSSQDRNRRLAWGILFQLF